MTEATSAVQARAPRASSIITPMTWIGALLPIATVASLVAAIGGVLVVPGLRGNAAEGTIGVVEKVVGTLSYAAAGLLVALVCCAAFEVARAAKIGLLARVVTVTTSGLAIALVSPGLLARLHPVASLALGVVVAVSCLVAGAASLGAPHTRATGGLLLAFGVAAILRVFAWEIAVWSGDRANVTGYDFARGLVTGAVVVEGAAQSLSGTWLAIKGKPRGLFLAAGAIVAAFALAWVAHRSTGQIGTAGAVLKSSIVDAQQPPTPFGLAPVQAFLLPVGITLAIAASFSSKDARPIAAIVALAVGSRARYDVPICALMATAAGLCALLAAADDRLRWRFITKEASESPTGFVRRPPPPAAKTDEAQKGGAEIPETTKPEDP